MFGEVAEGLIFFEKQHAQIDLFVRGLMFSHHTFPQFCFFSAYIVEPQEKQKLRHTMSYRQPRFLWCIFFTRSATSRKSSLGMIELGAHSNSINKNWICKTNLRGRGELSNDPSDARSGLNMIRFFGDKKYPVGFRPT